MNFKIKHYHCFLADFIICSCSFIINTHTCELVEKDSSGYIHKGLKMMCPKQKRIMYYYFYI